MAEETKQSYPKIPAANWWKLRERLVQRVPATLTPSYVASVLGMAESSARANIISPLKAIGLFDKDGKPTDLAYEWRDDSKYGDMCAQLIKRVYPQELIDLYHTSDADIADVQNWFMHNARVGTVAARMYATFYMMLLRADPKEGAEVSAAKKEQKPQARVPKAPGKKAAAPAEALKNEVLVPRTDPPPPTPPPPPVTLSAAPAVHIDIQIHVSPDTPPEQIDRIFSSMAKHLKDFCTRT